MHQKLTEFTKALRNNNIQVSPAETLDAIEVLNLVGYADRALFKESLSQTMAKTQLEKEKFEECFEHFFRTIESELPQPDTDPQGGEDAENESGESSEQSGEGESDGENMPGGGDQQPGEGDEEGAFGQSSLAQMLMNNDQNEISMAMTQAADEANLNQIRYFTQKGLFTRRIANIMGLEELDKMLAGEKLDKQQSSMLRQRREGLLDNIREHVDTQFLLYGDVKGEQLREEMLSRISLSAVEHYYFKDMQKLVQKMAKRLVSLYSRRPKRARRGMLDVRKTLRKNVAYDGLLFETCWKAKKIQRSKVIAICDVSGSVSAYAKFLLMFLYSLQEVLPNIRAFVFATNLYEVTDLFQDKKLDDAVKETMELYGFGSTDYGQAFEDFNKQCLDELDQRTTVIILGDGRNNYGNPRLDLLKEIYLHCKQLLWLNPEPPYQWSSGDSEMDNYKVYAHRAKFCRSLRQLEQFVNDLLKTA